MRVRVETDVISAEIALTGGDLRRVELTQFPLHKKDPVHKIPLLDDRDGHWFVIQSGLTGPGESWKAVENGDIAIGGRLPINPSGGLIGGGHPVGASGVRMLLDATKQVSGKAGEYQVEDAKTFGTLNFGGSTATTVSFVVGATPAA